jgi:hypothetical protein
MRSSARFRCWLIAGWLNPNAAAAAVIEPVSATVRTIRSVCESSSNLDSSDGTSVMAQS